MRRNAWLWAGVVTATALGGAVGHAQDRQRLAIPSGWSIHHVHVVGNRVAHPVRTAAERGLTVRKRFAPEADDGIFLEGGTVYGDVAAYVPAPRIDSGVQFPYGLDGVGGYGSDLGFSAGFDDQVYDRGALDRLRALQVGSQ